MNPYFSLPESLKEEIERSAGFQIRYPSDCERLSICIRDKINETIGVTTLKRLFGFVSDVKDPRISTLDILARFCEFEDFNQMKAGVAGLGDSDFEQEPDIIVSRLDPGAVVSFEYLPDRKVKLLYLGNSRFRVEECKNGSLQINDILHISSFSINSPLTVTMVEREGRNLGPYTAGKVSGISNLHLEEPQD